MAESDPFPLPPRLADLARDLPRAVRRFAPVPGRPRRDGWSPARQKAFMVRLALCGSVNAAAEAVGMTRRSAYKLLERPGAESFAGAWEAAFDCGRKGRLDHALEHALVGEVRPVFYRGRQCGEEVRFREGLTIAVLGLMLRKAAEPSKQPVVENKGISLTSSGTFENFQRRHEARTLRRRSRP